MSKKMHEIAKKLKRDTQTPNFASASPQPSLAGSTTAKIRERTPPWLLIEVLHQGRIDAIETIINQSELTETERILLNGMCAAWSEEATRAEQLLARAANQLVGVNKCWAHLSLAQLFLDLGNDEPTDYHISRARRYAYEDRQDHQCLSFMVELIDARADIERGAHERAHRTLSGVLVDCTDIYLKGFAHYLMGCLGRFREGMEVSERIEYLMQAANVFHTQVLDHYLLALTKLELSHCAIEPAEAERLAREASEELTVLGRTREARGAAAHATELAQQINTVAPAAIAIDNYERVGQCLFISAPMRALRRKLDAIAAADRDPVLILGPRGSGKELLAQSIHLLSPRCNGPLLAINCGALPEQLIESELFGYEKGAFTGATAQKRGLFELADGGTLFLDEIGELTTSAQIKLLRVLQTGQFRRVGGTAELKTGTRIIAATNRDLDEMARTGSFREDLLDRLCVWRLRIPPLSRRREEILPLAAEFLSRYGDGNYNLDQTAKQFLLEKDYPGNVRILENDIRRGIGNARAAGVYMISAAMICEDFDAAVNFSQPTRFNAVANGATNQLLTRGEIPNYDEAMISFERELLIRALAACQWNKKLAAQALGMSERTFWRAIQRHKLHTRPDNIATEI
ncbi:MAG: sigma 54-interacting transcriptional regulator [Acidobacteriota bacterium]